MDIFYVLFERNNGSPAMTIPCESLKEARSVLTRKMNSSVKKHNEKSLVEGKLFRDGDAFAFYDMCSGTWKFRGTIYKGKKSPTSAS